MSNTWTSSTVSPGPFVISTAGGGIGVGSVTYIPTTTTNLNPGDKVLASVPVYTYGKAQQLSVTLNGVTSAQTTPGVGPLAPSSNDLASQTNALVWVSPNSTAETAPTGTEMSF